MVGALLLIGNVCYSEMCGPGASCGAALSGSSAPMAPPLVDRSGDGDRSELDQFPPDQYELHGVTTPDRCNDMWQRFKNEGRQVRLIRAITNPSSGELRWICIFEGPDVNNDIFHDYRFNSPGEYQSP